MATLAQLMKYPKYAFTTAKHAVRKLSKNLADVTLQRAIRHHSRDREDYAGNETSTLATPTR